MFIRLNSMFESLCIPKNTMRCDLRYLKMYWGGYPFVLNKNDFPVSVIKKTEGTYLSQLTFQYSTG